MKREEPRLEAGSRRGRNGSSLLWEHAQIDISAETLCDGESAIHLFREWGIELRAIVVSGTVVDFLALPLPSQNALILPTRPPFDVSSESYGPYRHSLVYRSWEVPDLGVTIHVESWVDQGRGGFIDVFTRSENG